ncbi:MAG: kynureninase, partial [Chloroflexota bacterium]
MSHDPLLQWRDEFPILETCNYQISNSLGAMPRAVYDNLKDYADTWATLGVTAWGKVWWELNGKVGDKIAPLMGAPAGTVLVHQNASIANSILFSALDFSYQKRNKVVVTDMDFPSDYYVLQQWLPPHM